MAWKSSLSKISRIIRNVLEILEMPEFPVLEESLWAETGIIDHKERDTGGGAPCAEIYQEKWGSDKKQCDVCLSVPLKLFTHVATSLKESLLRCLTHTHTHTENLETL